MSWKTISWDLALEVKTPWSGGLAVDTDQLPFLAILKLHFLEISYSVPASLVLIICKMGIWIPNSEGCCRITRDAEQSPHSPGLTCEETVSKQDLPLIHPF